MSLSYRPGATAGGYVDRYQSTQVLTASPGRLVVLVYDHLLASLRRARYGVEQGDPALRAQHLARARDAINELLAALDREQDLAAKLHGLYDFMIRQLLEVDGRDSGRDLARIDTVLRLASELRDAFEAVADRPVDSSLAGGPLP